MLAGVSIWQLVIVLIIVVAIFGTKKLRNMGGDLGGAVKDFKDAVKEGEQEQQQIDNEAQQQKTTEQKEDQA